MYTHTHTHKIQWLPTEKALELLSWTAARSSSAEGEQIKSLKQIQTCLEKV
jgi:hypothetical protein